MQLVFHTAKFGAIKGGCVLFKVLSQLELKRKFEDAIDFERWAESSQLYQQFIPLTRDC